MIDFTGADGKRKSLRVGKMPKEKAESLCGLIEELLAAKMMGEPLGWAIIRKRKSAETTTRKICGFAKQFLADGVDRELVDRNPFTSGRTSIGVGRG